MIFLAPGYLLLTALAAPLIAMYVLRLRRPERAVSSTLLWPRIFGDMQANAPWQRLRPSWLLLLQLGALLALVVTLAQPAYSQRAVVSRDLIVVLDQSLTMQARDARPSRFVQARDRALALARSLAPGNVMSVIGMGSQPHLAIVDSSDARAIRRALARLSPQDSYPNVLAALSLATSLGRQGVNTQIEVLTDRSSGITGLPTSAPYPVDIIRFGGQRRDLAIASFVTRSGPAGGAVVRIHNYGPASATSDLELYGDGKLLDVRPVTVASGGEDVETWNGLPSDVGVLRAQLTVHDDQSVDKVAWSVPSTTQRRQVLLDTPGSYFLTTALTLDPDVRLVTTTPRTYSIGQAQAADLTIFDGVLPRALPAGPLLIINPPHSVAGLGVGPSSSLRGATFSAAGSGLFRYVDLSDVHIARARTLRLPPTLRPLLSARGMTVMAAGEWDGRRAAVVAFKLEESDWPLRVSFPVVFRNLVSYLAPTTLVRPGQAVTGQAVALVPPAGTRTVTVRTPTGRTDTLSVPLPLFTDTSETGVYTVHTFPRGAAASFAVNSLGQTRSDASRPAVSHLGKTSGTTLRRVSVSANVAWAFGVIALAAMTAEWWMSFKR